MKKIAPGEHLSPFEAQRKIHDLLAQETRFRIIQTILGHPEHLPSLSELAYYSQKSESAVLDQLDVLEEHSLVTVYELPEGRSKRDLPGTFYGLTERGTLMLDKYSYLQGIPLLRKIHEQTVKTAGIRRHEGAPRPTLPEVVADALGHTAGTEPGTDDGGLAVAAETAVQRSAPDELEETLRELANETEET